MTEVHPGAVEVRGLPAARARALAGAAASERQRLHAAKQEEFAHLRDEWRRMGIECESAVRTYCPVAYAELSDDSSIRLQQLELGVFPEMEALDHWCAVRCDACRTLIEPCGLDEGAGGDDSSGVYFWTCCDADCGYDICAACHGLESHGHVHPLKRTPIIPRSNGHAAAHGQSIEADRFGTGLCSAFVLRGSDPHRMVCGQTDEEHPPYNLHGKCTRILRVECPEGFHQGTTPESFRALPSATAAAPAPWCLLYAFGGQAICAMAGCNSTGLAVLVNTLYVCDNKFYGGVPTLAATRELLSCGSLETAVAYLRYVQPVLAIPLHFLVSQPGAGAASVEVSCRGISMRMLDMDTTANPSARLVHCNHCLSQELKPREVLPPISTHERQTALDAALAKAAKDMDDDGLFPCGEGAPDWVFRVLGRPPMHNSCVLATFVMGDGRMWVRFNQAAPERKGKGNKRKRSAIHAGGHSGEAGVEIEGITDWRMMDHIASRSPVIGYGVAPKTREGI